MPAPHTPTTMPAHTCCVTFYYNGDDPQKNVVRGTAVVIRMSDDKCMDVLDVKADDMSRDTFLDLAITLSRQYDSFLIVLENKAPIEHCQCGCGRALSRSVSRTDMEKLISNDGTLN